MANRDEFLALLRETFRDEAEEHLSSMRSGMLALEGTPVGGDRLPIVTTIYRAAHSLKGASRAVDLIEIETLCQALESLFQAMQRGKVPPSPALYGAVQGALDAVEEILSGQAGEAGQIGQAGHGGTAGAGIVTRQVLVLRSVMESGEVGEAGEAGEVGSEGEHGTGSEPEQGPAPDVIPDQVPAPKAEEHGPGESRARMETIRLPTERLDALLIQVEEMLSAKLSLSRQVSELKAAREAGAELDAAWSRIAPALDRVISAAKTDNPADANVLDEFFTWYRARVKRSSSGMERLVRSTENDSRTIGTMVDDLLGDAKRLLLMPFSSISAGFPKLVRDLARDLGKEVELKLSGEDVELEKRILERLKDPLIHLLRNAVDHGIEDPGRRAASGKVRRASISLSVQRLEGDRVELILADDGAGVDLARLREAVPDKAEAESLDDDALLSMVFRPGVSTSGSITRISGRGLGMSIVQEAVESLGGGIGLESRPGSGLAVRMTVPVTRATFRGVLVRVSGRLFLIPTASIRLVSRAGIAELGHAENRQMIRLEGKPCGLVHLAEILGTGSPRGPDEGEKLCFIVLDAAGARVAFVVDEIVDEMEVLVKPLGARLRGLKFVSGLAVLGNGEHVPILDSRNLAIAAAAYGGSGRFVPADDGARASEGGNSRKSGVDKPAGHLDGHLAAGRMVPTTASILVVEDSITSRLLLKNILEAAGYAVSTAVDGQAGFAALKSGHFDLVVSDVEMPRMDGFGLTEKIRADAALAKTPVILVTSLESREHLERGVDAGADAYMVKSGFDQGILLETIRRLL